MSFLVGDIARALDRPPRRIDAADARLAAVAAIFTPELDLLLMRRAHHPADPWSGHVSFPGGRVEPDDPSLAYAAMRETSEEIGVALAEAQLLGELDEWPTVPGLPRMVIRPFVFALSEAPCLRPNGEVASIHRVSLDALARGEGRSRFKLPWRSEELELPCVDFDGVRLWGLTLRIVDDLLDRLDGLGTGLDRPTR